MGEVKEDDKKAEEALIKHSNQECLSDFSSPHFNEVSFILYSAVRFFAELYSNVRFIADHLILRDAC